MSSATTSVTEPQQSAEALDGQIRDVIRWHFSPETGTPRWLDWAAEHGRNPLAEVHGLHDLLTFFPNFDGDVLRTEPHERWIPRAYAGRPFTIFETGGTTGMPKQRIGWEDYKVDYAEFSERLSDDAFPRAGYWLMMGPTGPRRLRLAVEYLANLRDCSCYFVDLDPRWVKRLIATGQPEQARAYMEHVVDQACKILRYRRVDALFTTPRLLEALSERVSIPGSGIKGVFCGGTTMSPQYVRFLIEEVLENTTQLVPTYGNTLMGLAAPKTLTPADRYSVTYYAPQPRAVLRVVDPEHPENLVDYDTWGRVELTTLTKELFMPRFLERDEALRRRPCDEFAWDGVGEVRPFGANETAVIEGVY